MTLAAASLVIQLPRISLAFSQSSTELGYEIHDGIYPNFSDPIPLLNTPVITDLNEVFTGYCIHPSPHWWHHEILS